LLVTLDLREGERYDLDGEMGENAELGDEGGIRKQENGETTQSKIIEKSEVFKESFFPLVDVVVAGDDHSEEDSWSSIVMGGRKA